MEVLDLARGASASVAHSVAGAASHALDAISPWAARPPPSAPPAGRQLAGASRAARSRARGANGGGDADDEQRPRMLQRAARQLRAGAIFSLTVGAGAALGMGIAVSARLLRRALLEAALCAVCAALEAEAEADALDFFLDLGALRALLRRGRLHAGEGADNAAHFASGVVVVRTQQPSAKDAAKGAATAAAAAASAAGADAFIHVLRDRLQSRLGPRFKVR